MIYIEPTGLKVVTTSQNSITVSWDQLSSVSGYKIRYAKSNSNNQKYMTVSSDQREVEITELKKNTAYNIQVAGIYFVDGNEKDGPYSNNVEGRTLSHKYGMTISLLY